MNNDHDDPANERHQRREAVRQIGRPLRVALVAVLATQLPRPRPAEIAAAGAHWTLLISPLLAALTLSIATLLAATAERARDRLDGWIR